MTDPHSPTAGRNANPPDTDAPMGQVAQRAILLFAQDIDAADDLRHLLALADSRPLHASPEGPGRGVQEPWSDDETRGYAWTLLQRLAGKVEWSATVIVP